MGETIYNGSSDPDYAGWVLGSSDKLSSDGTYSNPSNAYTQVKDWYTTNIINEGLEKYISKTAIYCNDRSLAEGYYYNKAYSFSYAGQERLIYNTPTLECINSGDRFKEGFGLMTLDEVMFAGGTNINKNEIAYYNIHYNWWTMTPINWDKRTGRDEYLSNVNVARVYGTTMPNNVGTIVSGTVAYNNFLRPVISINGIYSEGDGTSSNPYKIVID